DEMTGLISKHCGTLDKLIGDALMCYWGHPVEMNDHAMRATLCALEMIESANELAPLLALPQGAAFEIGIGINTGDMLIGDIGSQSRSSATVMGQAVNLGSRLESLNNTYRTRIIISETTCQECKETILCRRLDVINSGGVSVPIYEPL